MPTRPPRAHANGQPATARFDEQSSVVKKHGGKRPGAGRRVGTKIAKTLEIEAAAKKYAGDALQVLFEVATKGTSEPARVSAAVALLDRGYGKPRQAVEHTGAEGGPLAVVVTHRIIDPVRQSAN
jgi:hypothetical protein